MLEAIDKRALGLGGAALLVALIFTGLLGALRPDALLQWLMALAATFISVVFALALFWYQRDKSDEARRVTDPGKAPRNLYPSLGDDSVASYLL